MISLAFGLSALSFAGCGGGGGAKCTPGVLTLVTETDGEADDADMITFQVYDPPFKMTYPHVAGSLDLENLPITWPSGYPGDQLVVIHAIAYGGVQPLGEGTTTIHTPKVCGSGMMTIYPLSELDPEDGGTSDLGLDMGVAQ